MSEAINVSDLREIDNLIIGGGIVGVCCARQLQLRGEKVVIADRIPIGEGCSHGNAGVLCTWSVDGAASEGMWKDLPRWIMDPLGPVSLKFSYFPRLIPWLLKFFSSAGPDERAATADALFTLNNPTVDLYRQLIQGSGHEDLVIDSHYVFVARNAAKVNVNANAYQARAQRGAPVRALTQEDIRELEPDLSTEYVGGVAVGGHGRVTNPGRLTKLIGEMVMNDGGEFLLDEVRDIQPSEEGGATVTVSGETIHAKQLIVAAGAWSHQVAKNFDLDVPLEGERGYHMEFANPGVKLNNSVCDVDRKYVASSMEGGIRCAGTSEFNSLDAEPDWRRADIMKTLGKAMLPGLNINEGTPWMGHRPALPNSVPIVSQAPTQPGVFFAFGHGHYGLSAAPMTGRILAGLATGERMNLDLAPYSLERYQ